MIVERIPEIDDLSPRDKLILATELWEQIETDYAKLPPDDAIVELLEARHREYLVDPTKVISWSELKSKICNR